MPAVGSKFEADGSARRFAGSSIVCALDPASPVLAEAEWIRTQAQQRGLAELFAWLPPASFHMTVFDLLCDQVRQAEHWSAELPLDRPLAETDRWLARHLAPLSWPGAPKTSVTGLGPLQGNNTLHLRLEPADPYTASELERFRQAVSQATGVRHPTHDSYSFHLSLAYPLERLSTQQLRRYRDLETAANARLTRLPCVALGAPYLALFADMLTFPCAREQQP